MNTYVSWTCTLLESCLLAGWGPGDPYLFQALELHFPLHALCGQHLGWEQRAAAQVHLGSEDFSGLDSKGGSLSRYEGSRCVKSFLPR